MIYKTTLKNLIFSFALVMDRNNKERDNRAIALVVQKLNQHLIFLNEKEFSFINKNDFLKLLNYFYKKSLNKKVQKMPLNKFWKKYFKFLIQKKKIIFIKNIIKSSKEDIFIISTNKGFIIIS